MDRARSTAVPIFSRALVILAGLSALSARTVSAQTAACPNEPPGSTTLLDCSFDHPTCGGRLSDPYQSAGRSLNVVSDPSGPMSPSSVVQSKLTYPNRSGGTQLDFMAPGQIRNVYVCFYWKPSHPFGGNVPGSNKTFFIRDGFSSNGVFYWVYRYNEHITNPTNQNNGDLFWDSQFEGLNAHTCGGGGRQCWPNTGRNVKIVPGNWYRIEARMIGGTSATSKDSQLHLWINGIKTLEYTDIQYPPTYQNAWTWSETWDGYGNGTVPSGYTSDQSHFIDHLRVSTVGGGFPSPPPPPAAPPPPPPATAVPGSVIDLAASQIGQTSVTLSFSQVDDGAGAPAKYDVRFGPAGSHWGSMSSVTQGTCKTPLQGTATSGTLSCTVEGLAPATAHNFQLIAFRGTMNQGATYGALSNLVSATTAGASAATDVNGDGATNITDVQIAINQAVGLQACSSGDTDRNGTCDVVDIQKIVKAALGF